MYLRPFCVDNACISDPLPIVYQICVYQEKKYKKHQKIVSTMLGCNG